MASSISQIAKPTRRRPVVLLLLLLSITLIATDQIGERGPAHAFRSEVRDLFASLGGSVSHLWPFHSSGTARRLERENASLRAQLDAANGKLAQSADVDRERRELLALAGIPAPDGVAKTAARVIAINASNFDNTIEIDRGSEAGIHVGMPVVAGEGLVGRVKQTSGKRSTVLLITDTTSNVAVRFSPSGEIGVAVGRGGKSPLRVDLIEANSGLKQGDVAVTSGTDHSLFPPGIPVGRVRSSTAGPDDLRRNVVLDPSVGESRLDLVEVLQWRPVT